MIFTLSMTLLSSIIHRGCIVVSILSFVQPFRSYGHRRHTNHNNAIALDSTKPNIMETQQAPLQPQSWTIMAVNALINSPLYTPIVKIARNTMVKTATSVGVDWTGKSSLLREAQPWDQLAKNVMTENGPTAEFVPPAYYIQPFHAYSEGNLCMEAAIEQELAGKAVGARNFPNEGLNGENYLRQCYEKQLVGLGGNVLPPGGVIVDMGCGTGTSTRRLATMFPQASKVVGHLANPTQSDLTYLI